MTNAAVRAQLADYFERLLLLEETEQTGEEIAGRVLRMVDNAAPVAPVDDTEVMSEIEIDEAALQRAHCAVEDVLIDFRDRRVGVIGPANGFIVKEFDGSESSIMRLGTRDGLRIGIKAYLEATGGTA